MHDRPEKAEDLWTGCMLGRSKDKEREKQRQKEVKTERQRWRKGATDVVGPRAVQVIMV